jgi:class III poly(R)-hydroxyalkanoic acid synthase PhaE subunit
VGARMNQGKDHEAVYGSFIEAWMKMAGEFWKSMAAPDSSSSHTYGMPESLQEKTRNKFQESFESNLKMWSTMSSVLGEPKAMDAVTKGAAAVPEIITKAVGSVWEGYFRIHQQITEKLGRIGQDTEAFKFEKLDENIFRVWADIYEKELSPFFKVPQLGLTRFYQERLDDTLDKYNTFQISFAEFLRLLYLPIEKSAKVLQQNLEELTKEGKLPENSQDYYRMWIKILEGHYMTLFKSPEYAETLSETLNTFEDYVSARDHITQDFLQSVPVPTTSEMDELYREIYHLKKKVRKLEKDQSKD